MKEKYKQIGVFLQEAARYGWDLNEGHERGWQLAREDKVIYVDFNKYWLYFSLPFSKLSEVNPGMLTLLLEQCRSCFMCKCSFDGNNLLLLQLELPMIRLNRTYCLKAVEALTVYYNIYKDILSGTSDFQNSDLPGIKAENAAYRIRKYEVEHFPVETLKLFFQTIFHRGWGVKKQLGPNQWHCVYKNYDRGFDVYLSFDRFWACFHIPLLDESHAADIQNRTYPKILFKYLMQLNEYAYWAKFGLDREGQVLLMLDIPLEVFDLEYFRQAIRTLETYATDYSYEVQIIANLDKEKILAQLLNQAEI